ncbi:DEKNAAC104648 [Brettanomyces naardenensis]|uniref:DEKNAAC104648 n=1 Tax=Brettanomyces naardenensis TaxID=13370 RepID=A0A448YR82_BRENA|nr:DEKNAAC104648 [Brettanomyces naardenensis]
MLKVAILRQSFWGSLAATLPELSVAEFSRNATGCISVGSALTVDVELPVNKIRSSFLATEIIVAFVAK